MAMGLVRDACQVYERSQRWMAVVVLFALIAILSFPLLLHSLSSLVPVSLIHRLLPHTIPLPTDDPPPH